MCQLPRGRGQYIGLEFGRDWLAFSVQGHEERCFLPLKEIDRKSEKITGVAFQNVLMSQTLLRSNNAENVIWSSGFILREKAKFILSLKHCEQRVKVIHVLLYSFLFISFISLRINSMTIIHSCVICSFIHFHFYPSIIIHPSVRPTIHLTIHPSNGTF